LMSLPSSPPSVRFLKLQKASAQL